MVRKDYTPEEAMEQGRKDAEVNAKEQPTTSPEEGQDVVKEGQKTARENIKAEKKAQSEVESNELTNDTSRKAKAETTKSQLDPKSNEADRS